MKNKLNTKGYNFYMIEQDQWIFDDNGSRLFDGSFATVVLHAIRNGFKIYDIETGVDMMLKKDSDSIHFGTNKSPIYAFSRVNKKRAA